MQKSLEFVNGKWVGKFNGKTIVNTASKYYAEKKMAEFYQAEAKVAEVNNKLNDEFPIDQRFEFVSDIVKMTEVLVRLIP